MGTGLEALQPMLFFVLPQFLISCGVGLYSDRFL